jgi:vacuolar protein sorting-associated protein 72
VLELGIVRERAAAEAAAKPKPKVRRVVEERPLTQEEMLAEAVHTEALNKESLARILAMEEESKKRMTVVKEVYSGPIVRFRSARDGESRVFRNGAVPLDGAPRRATGYPARRKCAVTGRRARFRDPQTKQAYVDKAALRALRAAAAAGTLPTLPFYVRPPQMVGVAEGWGGGHAAHLGAF